MTLFNLLSYEFMRRAYVAGGVIAALCAAIGLYLVLRKLSLIGDGLSHVSFGAIALALSFGFAPLYVAIPLVGAASFLILALTRRAKIYGDAAIGIVSSVGIASGVLLSSVSTGFNVDLFGYLFGSILATTRQELILSIILSLAVGGTIIFLYHDLFSLTFDAEYAHISGVRATFVNGVLMALTAVVVILAVKMAGITLASALLILPAVTSLQIAKGFRAALLGAVAVAVGAVWVGITLSFYTDLPPGAVIVMLNFLFFVLSLAAKRIIRGR